VRGGLPQIPAFIKAGEARDIFLADSSVFLSGGHESNAKNDLLNPLKAEVQHEKSLV
jgi:hypothetical protein